MLYEQVLKIGGNDAVVEQAAVPENRIAERTMRKPGGQLRPDVLEYRRSASAVDIFATLPPEKVQAIGFEIAILGENGLDLNNPDTKYTLKELPGEFTGLKLAAFMDVAFQQIASGTNVGIDFPREYEASKVQGRSTD